MSENKRHRTEKQLLNAFDDIAAFSVFEYLSFSDKLSFRTVCRHFYSVSDKVEQLKLLENFYTFMQEYEIGRHSYFLSYLSSRLLALSIKNENENLELVLLEITSMQQEPCIHAQYTIQETPVTIQIGDNSNEVLFPYTLPVGLDEKKIRRTMESEVTASNPIYSNLVTQRPLFAKKLKYRHHSFAWSQTKADNVMKEHVEDFITTYQAQLDDPSASRALWAHVNNMRNNSGWNREDVLEFFESSLVDKFQDFLFNVLSRVHSVRGSHATSVLDSENFDIETIFQITCESESIPFSFKCSSYNEIVTCTLHSKEHELFVYDNDADDVVKISQYFKQEIVHKLQVPELAVSIQLLIATGCTVRGIAFGSSSQFAYASEHWTDQIEKLSTAVFKYCNHEDDYIALGAIDPPIQTLFTDDDLDALNYQRTELDSDDEQDEQIFDNVDEEYVDLERYNTEYMFTDVQEEMKKVHTTWLSKSIKQASDQIWKYFYGDIEQKTELEEKLFNNVIYTSNRVFTLSLDTIAKCKVIIGEQTLQVKCRIDTSPTFRVYHAEELLFDTSSLVIYPQKTTLSKLRKALDISHNIGDELFIQALLVLCFIKKTWSDQLKISKSKFLLNNKFVVPTASNRDVVSNFISSTNNNDIQGALQYYATDAVVCKGTHQYTTKYIGDNWYKSDSKVMIESIVEELDQIAVRYTIQGVDDGMTGSMWFQMNNGLIQKHWIVGDAQIILRAD